VSGNWKPRTAEPTPRTGSAYFHPGKCDEGELRQLVDVSRYAAAIDAGRQTFEFRGYVRSHPNHANQDKSRVVVEYLGANPAAAELAKDDTGPWGGRFHWNRVGVRRTAPPGTRFIRVRLISTVFQAGKGSTNHGFYDDLSLTALPPADQ
jgi:hypothetical protein